MRLNVLLRLAALLQAAAPSARPVLALGVSRQSSSVRISDRDCGDCSVQQQEDAKAEMAPLACPVVGALL